MAVLYGADAVYLAGTSFGMRSFAGNFDDEALPKAVEMCIRDSISPSHHYPTGLVMPIARRRAPAGGAPLVSRPGHQLHRRGGFPLYRLGAAHAPDVYKRQQQFRLPHQE